MRDTGRNIADRQTAEDRRIVTEKGESMQRILTESTSGGLPPWKTKQEWEDVQRTIADFIIQNRYHLSHAVDIAVRIRENLEAINISMDELCAATCPLCHEVCCSFARVWFDFTDLMFLHLINFPPPRAQPIAHLRMPCRFLTPRGCELPRLSRPWRCTLFLCRPQEAIIRKRGKLFQCRFHACLDDITAARKQLLENI